MIASHFRIRFKIFNSSHIDNFCLAIDLLYVKLQYMFILIQDSGLYFQNDKFPECIWKP